jgi:hypothetical protein
MLLAVKTWYRWQCPYLAGTKIMHLCKAGIQPTPIGWRISERSLFDRRRYGTEHAW